MVPVALRVREGGIEVHVPSFAEERGVHPEAERLIASLRLQPHPEGGWFRETFRSPELVSTARGVRRSASTAIYFLLTDAAFSAFHRLSADETWHFYRGNPVTIELIAASGTHERRVLGVGDALQTTVPAGTHFASHVDEPNGYALVGCDVAPGFEFADFQLTTRSMLTAAYPQFGPLIARYTR
jgi:predicted cupin superfamily sugar epimerase